MPVNHLPGRPQTEVSKSATVKTATAKAVALEASPRAAQAIAVPGASGQWSSVRRLSGFAHTVCVACAASTVFSVSCGLVRALGVEATTTVKTQQPKVVEPS